jgi:hypothetical protein
MKDFPNQPPYSAQTFAAWLRKHYPVAEPQDVVESEEDLPGYLEDLEENGDFFAFAFNIPNLAKRRFNHPIKLPDGRTVKGDGGDLVRLDVAYAPDYEDCVSTFADFLESLGKQRGLSALDLTIDFFQGRYARQTVEFAKAVRTRRK